MGGQDRSDTDDGHVPLFGSTRLGLSIIMFFGFCNLVRIYEEPYFYDNNLVHATRQHERRNGLHDQQYGNSRFDLD